jgi:hypothetical protein
MKRFRSAEIFFLEKYYKYDHLLGPVSYYSASGSTMTPPPTPSRIAVNGISQQPSTPYRQQQQQPMSGAHPVYPPIFFPMQANVSKSNK